MNMDLHNLFMVNACLWDSPTEKWAMTEEDFIKTTEQLKAETITLEHNMIGFVEWVSNGKYKWVGSYQYPYWSYNNGQRIADTTKQLLELYFESLNQQTV